MPHHAHSVVGRVCVYVVEATAPAIGVAAARVVGGVHGPVIVQGALVGGVDRG